MAFASPSKYKEVLDLFKGEDLDVLQEFVRLDNDDRKDDSQRFMTWFALAGMVFYPLIVVVCDLVQLDHASDLVSNMADMYFVSVSAIVMTFFGANAWTKMRRPPSKQQKTND